MTFSVVSTGTPLSYQWRKNGADLADYGNIAGANTESIHLVGVAQSDAGSYTVVISGAAGAITSAVATLTVGPLTVFSDDFESGSLANWTPFSNKGTLSVSTNQNHTPGGSQSALVSISAAKMYHNLGAKLAGRTRATFWIYDDGGDQTRWFGELRGHTGPGYGTYVRRNGRAQLFAIGRYVVGFGTNNTGLLQDERVDIRKYQGRVERGKNIGWFNLNAPGAPDRSIGWHRFEIERLADGTTVNFLVDGAVGRTIPDANHVLLDCVTIGSAGAGDRQGSAWFDDVRVEAYPWRNNWVAKDSTGKGLFDWMKLQETGVDPVVTDISQIATVSEALGANASGRLGRWATEGLGIYSIDMRGSLDFVLNAPLDDAYRIEVEGRERKAKDPIVRLPLIISIDGESLGCFVLPYGSGTNGLVHCFTPFLKAGQHTVTVFWDNADDLNCLYFQAVRLQTLQGPDLNGNGVKDWVENRLHAQSGIEIAPAGSSVSPVCIEGRGQYLSMMAMTANTPDAPLRPVRIQPGAGHRWYANVPLSLGKPTKVAVSFQNGGLHDSAEIEWRVTNLLEADNMLLRRGDSLLLTAAPLGASDGTVSISVVGVTNYTTDAETPIVHCFDQVGTFTAAGQYEGSASAANVITVTVVDASLDGAAAWVGERRFWDCTNLPPEIAIDADPRLKLDPVPDAERQLQKPTPPPLGRNGRQFSVTIDAAEPRVVLARLGADGPVVAGATIQGFRLFSGQDTYLYITRNYDDGSQLIEAAFVMSPVVPEVTFGVRVIVGGVTLEDGTLTKTLTASDFGSLGLAQVRFIRAPGVKTSVCHVTKAYQGGSLIGWPAYEK